MPNWTDKVKQIWNSTKDIDDNIEDLIKASIKRTVIAEQTDFDPWDPRLQRWKAPLQVEDLNQKKQLTT